VAEARIREATEQDAPLILSSIRELAEYEKLSDEVVATDDGLRESLFGERRYAEVLIAEHDGAPAGFAIFFHNFSTFLGKPGIYLEDLYVKRRFGAPGSGRSCWSIWQAWRKGAVVDAWSGGSLTGTSRQ
jgi:hypothetical protein